MNRNALRSRGPRWMQNPTELANFIAAIASIDFSTRIPATVELDTGAIVPVAHRIREIDFHEDDLDDSLWEVLEDAGFVWKLPSTNRQFLDAPLVPQSNNDELQVLRDSLDELANGTIAFAGLLALRTHPALQSDPVIAWANRGLKVMRDAQVSIVEACAHPGRIVVFRGKDFALGTFARELMHAAAGGVLGEVAARLDDRISVSNLLLLRNLGLAARWHAQHPTQTVPSELVVALDDGTPYELGRWIVYKRQTIRKSRAHPSLVDALRHAGIDAAPSRFERAWTRGITAFEQFIDREGHSRVPHDHVEFLPDGSHIDLEGWWRRTRMQYRHGELPEACIAQLHKLNIALDGIVRVREDAFRIRLADVDRFIAEYGHADIPSKFIATRPNGRRTYLGAWITYIRARAEAGLLEPDHIAALQRRGVRLGLTNPEHRWELGVAALAQFRAREGARPISERQREVLPDGAQVALGTWIARNKLRYRDGLLPQDRVVTLRRFGIDLDTKRNFEEEWQIGLRAFQQFATREHHGVVPAGHKEALPDGTIISLGNWVSTKRKQYKLGRVPADRVELLEAFGFEWDADAAYNRTGLTLLREYRKRHGHVDVPQRYIAEGPDNRPFPLGSFVSTRRVRLRNGRVTPAERAVLESLGLTGENRHDMAYRKGLEAFDAFVVDNGHGLVPRDYVTTTPDAIKLGSWVTNQRNQFREGLMSAARIRELTDHGFVWNQISARFEWCLEALTHAQEVTGQVRPSEKYEATLPDGSVVRIGQWLRSQQDRIRDGYMTVDQLERFQTRGVFTEYTTAMVTASAARRMRESAGR